MGPLLAAATHAKCLVCMLMAPEPLRHVLSELQLFGHGQKWIVQGFHPKST